MIESHGIPVDGIQANSIATSIARESIVSAFDVTVGAA
jgi:hypothetical protein